MAYASYQNIKEAYRYFTNAKETLSKSAVEYGRYVDAKYVREAAGIGYLAALKALDIYFLSNGVDVKKLPKSFEGYEALVRSKIPLNGKLMASLHNAWENLHVSAYYRGYCEVEMIKAGFENVKKIIDMIAFLMNKDSGRLNIVSDKEVVYKRRRKRNIKLT